MNDSPQELFNKVKSGDRLALSKAITLIESTRVEDLPSIHELTKLAFKHHNNALRIAITGIPGVGKSTLINSLVTKIEHKNKIAVLSIDPSSSKSGGSILGDKTRMQDIIHLPNVFVRPSPTRGSYGGVNAYTFNAILLCEAAGYDYIIIETVGVGQSEIQVRNMCDFLLFVTMASTGDELQGIKRGIMEQIDGIMINKADQSDSAKINKSINELKNALSFISWPFKNWIPEIKKCSAFENNGVDLAIDMIHSFIHKSKQEGFFTQRRAKQLQDVFETEIENQWLKKLRAMPKYQDLLTNIATEHPFFKAHQLINNLES